MIRSARRGRVLVGVVAVVLCALSATLAAPLAGAATAIPEVAPYFETTGPHTANLNTAVTKHGLTSFTAAFVLGKGCTPTWDDYSTITGSDSRSALVKKATAAGATPILSFGGESGNELAKVCTNATSLVTAYTGVIDKFKVSKIDFDIEGAGPLNDSATNARRYRAIKTLETNFPKLEVSLTIPVGLSGINADPTYGNAMAFLKLAKTQGARIDVVNLMTMNYGSKVTNMATAATTATKDALAQLKTIWPNDTYNNIGITPMIGVNESAGETFTYANAQTVVAFAHTNKIHRLAFWDVNRDQSCGTGDTKPDTCTGLTQKPLDYTDAFLG